MRGDEFRALAGRQSGTEAGIKVYTDKNYEGPSIQIDSAVPDLRKLDFDDRIGFTVALLVAGLVALPVARCAGSAGTTLTARTFASPSSIAGLPLVPFAIGLSGVVCRVVLLVQDLQDLSRKRRTSDHTSSSSHSALTKEALCGGAMPKL
jgi:hypothetical protein